MTGNTEVMPRAGQPVSLIYEIGLDLVVSNQNQGSG